MTNQQDHRVADAAGKLIGSLLGLFVVGPLLITFMWNDGIARLAHVETINAYWTAVALALLLYTIRATLAQVGAARKPSPGTVVVTNDALKHE